MIIRKRYQKTDKQAIALQSLGEALQHHPDYSHVRRLLHRQASLIVRHRHEPTYESQKHLIDVALAAYPAGFVDQVLVLMQAETSVIATRRAP